MTFTPLSNIIEGFPTCSLILISPPLFISTKKVYESLNLRLTKINQNVTYDRFVNIGKTSDFNEFLKNIRNDLERVCLAEFPEIGEIKDALLENGAYASLMSGSCSSVFGVYENSTTREEALKKLKRKFSTRNFLITGVDTL